MSCTDIIRQGDMVTLIAEAKTSAPSDAGKPVLPGATGIVMEVSSPTRIRVLIPHVDWFTARRDDLVHAGSCPRHFGAGDTVRVIVAGQASNKPGGVLGQTGIVRRIEGGLVTVMPHVGGDLEMFYVYRYQLERA